MIRSFWLKNNSRTIKWTLLSTLTLAGVLAFAGCQAGEKGEKGDTPIITIGNNGNWFLDGVDTNVKGQGDKGEDAIAPQIRINEITNEWEISTDNGDTWVPTYVSATGNGVDNGPINTYTVRYEYNVLSAEDLFVNYTDEQRVDSNKRLLEIPTPRDEYIEDFDGWYIKGTNTKVDGYSFISGDVTLVDRWKNYPSIPAGVYRDGNLVMNWNEFIFQDPYAFQDDLTIIESSSIINQLDGTLVIDNSIRKIGDSAFYSSNLTTITIPSSATEIGGNAFLYCYGLTEVILDTIDFSDYDSRIFENSDVVYIREDLSVEGFGTLETDFTKQETSDKIGYDKYVRNVVNQ